MTKELIQIQIALFFSGEYTGNFETPSLKIKNRLGDSQATLYFPAPLDAPSEIPRLSLRYPSFNINFSKNRADLFSDNFNNIKDKAIKIAEVITNDLSFTVVRLAMVKNFFATENINFLKKVLNTRLESLESKEIMVRLNLEQKIIDDVSCNNIEIVNLGSLQKNTGTGREGLLITRDMNTILNGKSFDIIRMNKIFDAFDVETNKDILFE